MPTTSREDLTGGWTTIPLNDNIREENTTRVFTISEDDCWGDEPEFYDDPEAPELFFDDGEGVDPNDFNAYNDPILQRLVRKWAEEALEEKGAPDWEV